MSDFMKTHGRPVGFGGDMRGYDSDKDPHHPDFGLINEPKKETVVPTPKKKPTYKSDRNLFDLADKREVPKLQEKPKVKHQTPFEKHFEKIVSHEGGYNDRSQSKTSKDVPTNFGIRKETLIQFREHQEKNGDSLPEGYTDDPRKVTLNLAKIIYDEMYHKRYKINKVNDDFTVGHLLDMTINPGPKRGIQWFQQSLDKHLGTDSRVKNAEGKLEYDGILGPKTRSLIDQAKDQGVLTKVNNDAAERRLEFYNNKADQDKTKSGFKKGWSTRAKTYKRKE